MADKSSFLRSAGMLVALAALSGCHASSVAQTPTDASAQLDRTRKVAPSNRAEEASALAVAESFNRKAPAMAVANELAGLDPTGIAHLAVDAEMRSHAAALQQHLPGLVASSRMRAEQYCGGNPSSKDCAELRRLQREVSSSVMENAPSQ